MDGSGSVEHSDSDSGDSWTLLDHAPAFGEETPEFRGSGTPTEERNFIDTITEKDEDTDGISIISDSEPESTLPCETGYKGCEDDHEVEQHSSQYIPIKPSLINNDSDIRESMSVDDFLGDSSSKHKTYVHRRNKRLSTVLNIIMLGSVITAAGVAIGHMWGAKNDCSVNTTPSINKVLSNLYKLQEENAYLRSKLKELTLINNVHVHQRKSGTESASNKHNNKCKKVFEESLNKRNSEKAIKCLDGEDHFKLDVNMIESDHNKEFSRDIKKIKYIYKQHRSWLDYEVSKRLNIEKKINNSLKNEQGLKSLKFKKFKPHEEQPQLNGEILETIREMPSADTTSDRLIKRDPDDNLRNTDSVPDRKISYADSLKSDQNVHVLKEEKSNVTAERTENKVKEHHKKKTNNDLGAASGLSFSEDEFKKDDRYTGLRHEQKRKKHDRQKLHKKQKRKNKYEQWEMKGGYLKDYDDFSVTSSQDNEYVLKKPDKHIQAQDFEQENYIEQFVVTGDNEKTPVRDEFNPNFKLERRGKYSRHNMKNREKEITWFEKRAVLRNEARKKLEHELFGETSPNNAGWYFRRMQRREQCRAKGDNSTYKKLSKRNMNFKMKH